MVVHDSREAEEESDEKRENFSVYFFFKVINHILRSYKGRINGGGNWNIDAWIYSSVHRDPLASRSV